MRFIRWYFYLVLAYLGCVPLVSLFASPMADHDVERIAQIGMGTIGLAALWLDVYRLRAMEVSPRVLLLMVVATIFAIGSIANSASIDWALREVDLIAICAVCALAAYESFRARNAAQLLGYVVIVAYPLTLLILFLVVATLYSGDSLLRWELIPGYSNFRFFNHVQTVIIPLLVAAAANGSFKRHMRWSALLLAALNLSYLFFTAGRATMLGIAGAVVAILLSGANGRAWLKSLAIAAVCGGVVYGVLFVGAPEWRGVRTEMSAVELASNTLSMERRWYLWEIAVRSAMDHPLFGIGPMQFAHTRNLEAAHPHNFFLQLAAEWGMPMAVGGLCLALIGLLRMWLALRRSSSSDQAQTALGMGLIAACVAVSIDSMFSGNLVMPMSQTWVAVTIGWAIACGKSIRRDSGRLDSLERAVRMPRIGLILLCSAALLFHAAMAAKVFDQARTLDDHLQFVRANIVHNDHDSPRFWSNGWF